MSLLPCRATSLTLRHCLRVVCLGIAAPGQVKSVELSVRLCGRLEEGG
jgi:hypothetical protein